MKDVFMGAFFVLAALGIVALAFLAGCGGSGDPITRPPAPTVAASAPTAKPPLCSNGACR